jgi:AcrR family transcriptional regulator
VTHDTEVPLRGARLPRGARRLQLLDAAQDVFVANGYHAAAMDDIAGRAGVSKPVLYQHFPGKLELYLALLERNADALVARIHEALDTTHDNKRRVQAAVEAYFAFVDDPAAGFRLLFENDLMSDDAVRDRLDRVTRDCAEAICDVIAEDTGLPDDEAMLLAVALVGTAHVAARYWLADAGRLPRGVAAQLVAQLGWRGIRGFPRRDDLPS